MQKLKILRKSKNLKQKDVAEKLNVSTKTISNYENGNRKLPITYVSKLANLYEVDIKEIVEIAEEEN